MVKWQKKKQDEASERQTKLENDQKQKGKQNEQYRLMSSLQEGPSGKTMEQTWRLLTKFYCREKHMHKAHREMRNI